MRRRIQVVLAGLVVVLISTARPVAAQTPAINAGGVVNGASYAPDGVLAPGLIFSIFGVNLTNGAQAGAPSTPLPTRLAGARVLVNGVEAPLFYVHPLQINAQFPVELAGLESAQIQVEVERTGGTLTSEAETVPVAPVSPGIFTYDQSGSGHGTILRNSDFSRICPEGRIDCSVNRAAPGEVIAIFLTGLGQVMGPWVSGDVSAEASRTVDDPVVTIGGIETPVLFSGLAAGFVGLYQVNVAVLEASPVGNAVPLRLTLGGRTHEVTIAIGSEGSSGGAFTDSNISALVVDVANPSNLLAGTGGDGIFRSADGGRSWARTSLPFANELIRALAIDPTNSSFAYAAGGLVYRSTDGGRTWTQTPELPLPFSLAIDRVNPATIYVGTNRGVFKSTDRTASWQASNSGITDRFVNTLVIDPANPATVYAGTTSDDLNGGRVFKSTDGGATWTPVAEGLPDAGVSSLAIDPANPATIYASTNNDIYKSVNGGQSWDSLSFVSSSGTILIDPTAPDTVYAGTPGSGVYKSVDGGLNWVASSEGLDNEDRVILALALDPTNPATLYAGTLGGRVYVSNDGAATWHLPGTD